MINKSLLLSIITFCILSKSTFAQLLPIDTNVVQTNGEVYDMARGNGLIYVTGNFDYAGKRFVPYGHTLNLTDGQLDGYLPLPDGPVNSVVSDGTGGWYLGGSFQHIGDSARSGLAHIDANSQVTSFFHNKAVDGSINEISLQNNQLYVAGNFKGLYEKNSPYGGAVSPTTGILQPTFRGNTPDGEVMASINDGSGGWYIGGAFTHVGSVARAHVAHIDANGQVTPWQCDANNNVRSLLLNNGNLYIGGEFTTLAGLNRNYLGMVNPTTGAVQNWNPSPNGPVYAVTSGSTNIYFGGEFSVFSGQVRNNAAGILASSQQLLPWNPNTDGAVRTMLAADGVVYLGGYFSMINNGGQAYMGAVNETTGNNNVWTHPTLNDAVLTISNMPGVILYGGLVTNGCPTCPCQYMLQMTAAYGVFSTSNIYTPLFNGIINSVLVDNVVANDLGGGTIQYTASVYVGGYFDQVSSRVISGSSYSTYNKKKIARFTTSYFFVNGNQMGSEIELLKDSWVSGASGNNVNTITSNGNSLYIGGQLNWLGANNKNHLMALETQHGEASIWSPQPDNSVNSMQFIGSTIYISGAFANVSDIARPSIAALNTSNDATVLPWNPNPTGGSVYTLGKSNGQIFAFGSYTSIGGQARTKVAVLNATTGLATATQFANLPNLNFNYNNWDAGVNDSYLAVSWNAGNQIYRYNASTGAQLASITVPIIRQMQLVGDHLYLSGWSINGAETATTLYSLSMGTQQTSWKVNPNWDVVTAAEYNGRVYVGGTFTAIGGENMPGHLFAFDPISGSIVRKSITGPIEMYKTLTISGPTIYGGTYGISENSVLFKMTDSGSPYFSSASSITAYKYLDNESNYGGPQKLLSSNGKIYFSSNSYTNWNLTTLSAYDPILDQVNFSIATNSFLQHASSLKKNGNKLFFYEDYPGIGLRAIDSNTGASLSAPNFVTPTNYGTLNGFPLVLSGLSQLEVEGNIMYLAGVYNNYPSPTFSSNTAICAFDFTTGALDSFNVSFSATDINVLLKNGLKLHVAGSISTINGNQVSNYALINGVTGSLLHDQLNLNGPVNAVLFDGDNTYAAGNFTLANGIKRSNIVKFTASNDIYLPQVAQSYCLGEQVQLDFISETVFNANNVFSLQLSDANGDFTNPVTIGTSSSTFSASISGVIPSNSVAGSNYRLRVISSSPASIGSVSGNKFIINAASASVGLTASSQSVCAGSQVELQASPVNPGNDPTYSYYVNGIQVASSSSSTYTLSNLIENSTVYCIMNSNAQCISTPDVQSENIQINVTPIPTVNTHLVANDSSVCALQPLVLSMNGDEFPAGTEFTFYKDGVIVQQGTQSTFTIASLIPQPTTYIEFNLVYTLAQTCAQPVSVPMLPITILLLPSQPSITANVNSLLAANYQSGDGLQWYFNGAPITGATSMQYFATQTGNYSVETISASTGCSSMSPNYFYTAPLGISEVDNLNPLNLFPNPVNDRIQLTYNGQTPTRIEIMDMSGRIIFHSIWTNAIDTKDFAPGTYMIRVYENKSMRVRKFSVIH